MKVTVERAQLLKSLGHVHRVVERRNTIPILGNVLVRAENAKLSLKATDLDLEVTETLAGRNRDRGLHHRAGAHVLRHRAQAARWLADRAGSRRRPRRAGDPRRPLALHAADPAGERFPGSRRRRHVALVLARRQGRQAADRPHPVRDLDRRDALLSQRHLSARRGHGQGRDPARRRHRRPSARPARPGRAQGRRRHARRDRAAENRRRGAAPDRGQRGRSHDRAVAGQDPLHHRQCGADLEADRRHLPRLWPRDPAGQRQGTRSSTRRISRTRSTASPPSPASAAAP